MKTVLKTFGIIIFTIIFLSIKVKNKTIFSHAYKFISPGTEKAQIVTEDLIDLSVDKAHKYSKKIFDNSVPKVKDSIKSKMAARSKNNEKPLEDIAPEEKEELDELIKSH